jgi:hypothetical protein
MWRGSVWRPSLPSSDENNFEVGSDQHPFTSEEILNKGTASGTAPTLIEAVNNAGYVYDSNLNPGLANDVIKNSPSIVPGSSNPKGVTGIERSAVAPLEHSTSDSVIPSRKSALHGQSVVSDGNENGDPVQRSPVECRKSVQYPDEQEASVRPLGSSDEIGELETISRNTEGLNNQDGAKTVSTSSSYMEGVLLLLKQATGSGRAHVLDENEFVDADVIYEKSVAFAKRAPRGPVFKNTLRKSSVRKNEPNKSGRVKKHPIEDEVPSNVEKKDDVNRGLITQRNELAQEFLSDVVPQGTLRVDELAKLLA